MAVIWSGSWIAPPQPWKVFLSREVTAVFGALAAIVVVLALATFLVERGPLWRSVYLPLLDIFTMGDPATDGSPGRRILQLVAGFVGLAVLPLVVAAAMNATDAFRAASASWGLLWPGVSPRPCPAL
ncbi:hypothetical protein OG453_31650 [Streptomyces sp. NBC_01381]|uniref:hypothetical protein n=1 Tax=Streptomyces sp. NBC_01381 TaxID=2903845 RepID=UPI00224EEE8A|nr:hypothetical protein [Streptomyces sp. NBC_01381]MCX4671183.1 hypothetical protein [Streptomyces sp. NBC_01381]